MEENKLDYYKAKVSPCETCISCPCCSLFQLDYLTTNNLMEIDTINYYLNFHNIEVCLSAEGEWTVYYNYPCRFFDTGKSLCKLHATPQKPGICVNYNPHHCYYKKVKEGDNTSSVLWISRERMDFIISRVSFDEDRNILDIQEKEKLFEEVSRIPYQTPHRIDAPGEDKVVMEWKQSVLANTKITEKSVVKSYFDFYDPCSGCDSYCCKSLVFPHPVPLTYASLDYIRYAMGFPGVELGISDTQWFIILKTTCRHLTGSQCSIYEKPERPLVCKFYNSMYCFHKPCFSVSKTEDFMRIGGEEFNWLLDTFKFDDFGNIIENNDIGTLRPLIESKWLDQSGKSRQIPKTILAPGTKKKTYHYHEHI